MLGVFKTILLYCVMSCMVCDEAFVGRAPQSIPCLVCAGLVCRICYGGLVVVVTVIRVNQIVCFVIISKKIYI